MVVPAKYKPESRVIDFTGGTSLEFKLQPITEITTVFVYPTLVMTPTGVAFKAAQVKAIASLNIREPAEIVSDFKPVTNYGRKDLKEAAATRTDSVNSFCVTPDGQHVLFSLTEHDEQENFHSNLLIKQTDDVASGVSRLTVGNRWDTLPDIANDGSNHLVFASNRGDRSKPDIYRVHLVDNRLASGISRLTNDTRFNFAPTYGDSNRQLYYLSVEPNYPMADSQISSIRFDGALPTVGIGPGALEINNTFADKVYYVKIDEDSKKKQIFSMTTDGKLETALINQEDFKRNNCFNPAVSSDGARCCSSQTRAWTTRAAIITTSTWSMPTAPICSG